MGSLPEPTCFLHQGSWKDIPGLLASSSSPVPITPRFKSRAQHSKKYLGKHDDFASVFIHCLDGAMHDGCANHFPRDLSPPGNSSYRLVADGEVDDGLRLRAAFRHYLQFKHQQVPAVWQSHLFSISWTAYTTSVQMCVQELCATNGPRDSQEYHVYRGSET